MREREKFRRSVTVAGNRSFDLLFGETFVDEIFDRK